MTITSINKEQLDSVVFAKNDVLVNTQLINERNAKLQKALKLGNIYKNHVKILFVNARGHEINVTATVWALTEKYVILKNHIFLPIRSIKDVQLVA